MGTIKNSHAISKFTHNEVVRKQIMSRGYWLKNFKASINFKEE